MPSAFQRSRNKNTITLLHVLNSLGTGIVAFTVTAYVLSGDILRCYSSAVLSL